MGGKKTTSIVLLIVGIAILVLSLFANSIGIGNPARFGYIQIIGAIVGAIVAVVGLVMTLRG